MTKKYNIVDKNGEAIESVYLSIDSVAGKELIWYANRYFTYKLFKTIFGAILLADNNRPIYSIERPIDYRTRYNGLYHSELQANFDRDNGQDYLQHSGLDY